MTQDETDDRPRRGAGGPGAFSRWVQRKANARTNRRIRAGKGRMMGMDMLVLRTVGRRSGQQRETPLARFPDGDGAWLVVASGGGDRDPDWYANLVASPERVEVELPGGESVPVAPHRLEGAERQRAWEAVVAAQPRLGKYQAKSGRVYPVVRLARR